MTDAPPPYPGIYGAWAPPQGAGAMAPPPSQMNGATSSADAKAAEAAASGTVQTGYYDPTNPQTAYIPPGTVSRRLYLTNFCSLIKNKADSANNLILIFDTKTIKLGVIH